MYNLLTKNGQMYAFGLGAGIVLLTLISILTGIGDDFGGLAREEQFTTTAFNLGIILSIALVVIGVVLMVFFGLFHVVSDLKGSVKGLAGLGVIVAVFFIARAMASTDREGPIGDTIEKFFVTDGVSTTISACITTVLIMGAVAVGVFVISEVRNFFK